MSNTATEDNGVYMMSVQDTPKKKGSQNKRPDPGMPCSGSPCSEAIWSSVIGMVFQLTNNVFEDATGDNNRC